MIIYYFPIFIVPRKGLKACTNIEYILTEQLDRLSTTHRRYRPWGCPTHHFQFSLWVRARERDSQHGSWGRLSQQCCTYWTWRHRCKPILPDLPLGHLVNQRTKKHLQKKDFRDLGKWKAAHWSSWHLPEGTAGDINNHFSHQTVENERRVRGKKKKCFAASCLN